MSGKLEQFGKLVISGDMTGPVGAACRGLLRLAEPVYAAAMRRRNAAFDDGRRASVRLDRPTISVGNLTTGGTGKTPVVRWLAQQLIRQNVRPAILLRGYRATESTGSDEQVMLEQFLGPRAVVSVNADRVAGAASALAVAPDGGAFILDDGFQHRRVRRDLNIVLISAIEPFGYGHVFPRGLLREPIEGLGRADAVIITHAQRVSAAALEAIKSRVREVYRVGPIYHADHSPAGFRTQGVASSARVDEFDDALRDEPVIAFCGLGEPRVFQEQLTALGARVLETHAFKDHHAYTAGDLDRLYARADALGAKQLITTEKDWVKVQRLPLRETAPAIWRLDVLIRFWFNDESMLLEQVNAAIQTRAMMRG
jgi:tetraacyldisaccharide 4'-kinase